jgi:hypothetical protein
MDVGKGDVVNGRTVISSTRVASNTCRNQSRRAAGRAGWRSRPQRL